MGLGIWCNGSTTVFGSVWHGSSPCGATKVKKIMSNITLSIEDNNKKAKAYLSVDNKELTIQVVTEVTQYDFVLSEDDLKLIDFLRKKK